MGIAVLFGWRGRSIGTTLLKALVDRARAQGCSGLSLTLRLSKGGLTATAKQRNAARRNVKKAAAAARRKQTLKHLPKATRRALGKEGAKARRRAA
jgi:GNAT superfamily N-acetyltransferase